MPLVAGVDCSTQSTKVVVVDADTGAVVATGRAEHVVRPGADGRRETHPDGWWDALRGALRGCGRAGELAAISVAGQQHGLCVLGEDGRPLRPAMLWNDTRAAPDASALVAARGAEWWAEHLGVVPVASFTAAKWAWLRRVEPEIAAATHAVRLPHDLLVERLTGVAATDRSDASGTAWWSTATEDYAEDVLTMAAMQLDPSLLPAVLGPTDVVGAVTDGAREALGLPTGCLVAAGCGDNAGAALGLGVASGTPVVSLGTSGTAYAVSTDRVADPSGTIAGFADARGDHLPLAATLNCTLATDRVAGWLGLDRDDVAAATDCVVLPYLDGERTPNLPHAAGTIAGLRHDTTPQQVLRAAYEGAAASLVDALAAIDDASSGLDPDAPLVVVGGGARGAAWRDVLSSMTGRVLLLPHRQELVATGAAVQAACVLSDDATPSAVADAWGCADGDLQAPPADHDGAGRLATIRATRALVADLLSEPLPVPTPRG